MNSSILLIPLFLIRYGLLSLLSKEALGKASLFTPMEGIEKSMFTIYQTLTFAIIIYLFFLKINITAPYFFARLGIYLFGVMLFVLSTVDFSKPSKNGINQNGLYKISRNPMYVAYFVYFLGCVALTWSLVLFVFLMIFQVSAHWIILSEERWCKSKFGNDYIDYMKKVRRYI